MVNPAPPGYVAHTGMGPQGEVLEDGIPTPEDFPPLTWR